mmetsp:Transcript_161022/g.283774  ORF Transcript_161022/g.283774 Transcript_161022/m.283774 type:complete len:223 (-) Transcript_161022:47-715(-)
MEQMQAEGEKPPTDADSSALVETNAIATGSSFSVTLRCVDGSTFEVFDLQSELPLKELIKAAAGLSETKPHLVQLGVDCQVLSLAEGTQSLQQSGISEGMEIMLVRRKALRLDDPGVSRYNRDYFCTLSRIEEVGYRMIDIDFEVVGDMSLGKLQNPLASSLWWSEAEEEIVVPSAYVFTKLEEECVAGTLTYSNVPLDQKLLFQFGEAGYSKLSFNLSHDS